MKDEISEKTMIIGLFVVGLLTSFLVFCFTYIMPEDIFYVDYLLIFIFLVFYYCGWLSHKEYLRKRIESQ